MTEICVDPSIVQGGGSTSRTLVNSPYTSNVFTLQAIDSLVANFESKIVNSGSNPVNQLIDEYTEPVFTESLLTFNQFLYTQYASNGLIRYPFIKTRVETGTAISQVEYADFINTNLYTPVSIEETIISAPVIVLTNFNNYYNGSFSDTTMGTFCSLVPDIFGKIDNFFTQINSALFTLHSIATMIEDFSLTAMIDTLKNNILSVVEQIIQNELLIVQNALASFNGYANILTELRNERILQRFIDIKNDTLTFFNEENTQSLSQRIESLIAYSASVYENLGIEEIQYLIYRFCSFITNVENLIRNIKSPLIGFTESFEYARNQLNTNSSINTVRAVAAGGIRYTEETRQQEVAQMTEQVVEAGNAAPTSIEELEGVTSWNNGSGDSRIGFPARLNGMGEEGWIRVDQRVRVLIMRVQTRFGRRLLINSGYRSPAYNASLRPPGARNSYHMQGLALDVSWSGFNTSSRNEFVRISREEGFRGIGYYNSFIHVDLGPIREWGR